MSFVSLIKDKIFPEKCNTAFTLKLGRLEAQTTDLAPTILCKCIMKSHTGVNGIASGLHILAISGIAFAFMSYKRLFTKVHLTSSNEDSKFMPKATPINPKSEREKVPMVSCKFNLIITLRWLKKRNI